MFPIERIEQALLSIATHEKSEIYIKFNNCHPEYISVKKAIAENLYGINDRWINEETKKHAADTDKMWSLSVSYTEEDESITNLWNRQAQSLQEILEEVPSLPKDTPKALIKELESELTRLVTGEFSSLCIRYNFVSDYNNDYEEKVKYFDLKSDKTEGMLWNIVVYPNNPGSSYRFSALSLREVFNHIGLAPLVGNYDLQDILSEKTDKKNKIKL